MSAEDRETLSVGLAHGHSLRMMASVLGRAPSTISRESARNTTRGHPYRACTAQIRATARAWQPRRPRKTPGSLALAVREDASSRELLARTDCGAPSTHVS
nr:helix-turn-helix domain-containing protein [Candidatus Nitrospira nitrificans]